MPRQCRITHNNEGRHWLCALARIPSLLPVADPLACANLWFDFEFANGLVYKPLILSSLAGQPNSDLINQKREVSFSFSKEKNDIDLPSYVLALCEHIDSSSAA